MTKKTSIASRLEKLFRNRPVRGLTVGEAYSKLDDKTPAEVYFSRPIIRGRVYDLVARGTLVGTGRTRNGGQVFTVA